MATVPLRRHLFGKLSSTSVLAGIFVTLVVAVFTSCAPLVREEPVNVGHPTYAWWSGPALYTVRPIGDFHPTAINNSNDVVGWRSMGGYDAPVIYRTDYGSGSPGKLFYLFNGQFSFNKNGPDNGTFALIEPGTSRAEVSARAVGINDRGEVVVWIRSASVDGHTATGGTLVYEGNEMGGFDNALDPVDVNERGDVLFDGNDAVTGKETVFELGPEIGQRIGTPSNLNFQSNFVSNSIGEFPDHYSPKYQHYTELHSVMSMEPDEKSGAFFVAAGSRNGPDIFYGFFHRHGYTEKGLAFPSGGSLDSIKTMEPTTEFVPAYFVPTAVNWNHEVVGVVHGTSTSGIQITSEGFYADLNVNGWKTLGTFGGTESDALAVNANGTVVGWADTSQGYRQALIYRSTQEINDNDMATFFMAGSPPADIPAGIWNLNSMIPMGSGWNLEEADAINDHGDIVGWGTLNGYPQAFLLMPVRRN